MGMWNGSCGLSRLPILEGEKVRYFLLGRNSEYLPGGSVIGNEVWYPRTVPIRSSYNAYGGIKPFNTDLNAEVIFEGLRMDFVPSDVHPFQEEEDLSDSSKLHEYLNTFVGRGTAKVHSGRSERRVKQEQEYFQKLLSDPIHYNDLDILKRASSAPEDAPIDGEDDRPITPIGSMMVLESVYQSVLTAPVSSRVSLDKLKEHGSDFLKTLFVRQEDLSSQSEEFLASCRIMRTSMSLMGLDNLFIHLLQDPSYKRGTGFYFRMIQKWVDEKRFTSPNDRALTDLIDQMAEFAYFSFAMRSSRIAYYPPTGLGSQDERMDVQASIAAATLQHAYKKWGLYKDVPRDKKTAKKTRSKRV